jgi:hypothetical protein
MKERERVVDVKGVGKECKEKRGEQQHSKASPLFSPTST